MARRFSSLAVVALLAGVSSTARAQGGWCMDIFQPGDHHGGKPECYSSLGFNSNNLVHQRVNNVCDTADQSKVINVDLVYPSPAILAPGVQLQPIIFQHGGGTANSFCDKHTNDSTWPYDCGPEFHYANPYAEIGNLLAHKGAVVMFPILPIGPGTKPWDDGQMMMQAITCLGTKTSPITGTGGCGELGNGEPDCIPGGLAGHVAWSTTNKQNLVIVGHSAGGVAGLYVPKQLGHAIKGIILVDAEKADYLEQPPSGLATGTPIIHIYPDWYGPRNNGSNLLFNLYNSTTGAYVPIGVREGPSCNPDTGCHRSHHCNSLGDSYSWVGGFNVAGHENFCSGSCSTTYNGQPYTMKTPPSGSCPGGAASCGRDKVCRNGPTKPPTHTWSWGDAHMFTQRYVVAYATCLGGAFGAEYQSWVNGKDRELDDLGTNQGICVRWDGQQIGLPCSQYTLKSTCLTDSFCRWAQGEDGQAIRVNNGQLVTEYAHDQYRYYTAAEGYNSSNGDFTERTERLGVNGIRCQSGYGSF